MTKLLAVGFTARARKDNPVFEFRSNKGTNDPAKQAAQIEAKRAAAEEQYPFQPYVGTMQRITLTDVADGTSVSFEHDKTSSASVKAWNWIADNCPLISSAELLNRNHPETLFVGWHAKQFIKLLALEVLERGVTIPPSFWYSSGNYRDMYNILFPFSGCRDIPLTLPLQRFGINCGPNYQPHMDSEADANVITATLRALNITGDSIAMEESNGLEQQLV